ncbi:hypothetical protein GCM10020220_017160 [Nonomuraea rubra]
MNIGPVDDHRSPGTCGASGSGGVVADQLSLVKTSPDTPPPPGRYEAETAPGACVRARSTRTGPDSPAAGFCNGNNAAGAYAQFTVNASAAGTATLGIRFVGYLDVGAACITPQPGAGRPYGSACAVWHGTGAPSRLRSVIDELGYRPALERTATAYRFQRIGRTRQATSTDVVYESIFA